MIHPRQRGRKPSVGGFIYHGYVVRYTMDKWLDMPLIGGPTFNGESIIYTMGRGSINHGYGARYAIGSGFNIPLIGCLR